jgi:peptidoglycan hydrolase-like protein with peptidoglycan-binding domain
MVAWREAVSTRTALAELNKRAPKRSKASDGAIGDAAHASRASDHNPWVNDPTSSLNVVTARDFTHHIAAGANMGDISETLRKRAKAGKMPWLKYLIFNRRIASKKTKWVWVKYTGSNPHTKHMHASVEPTKSLYDTTKAWGIYAKPVPVAPVPVYGAYVSLVKPGVRTLRRLSAGDDVKWLQAKLKIKADGYFGDGTLQSVKKFQAAHKLLPDGVVGTSTWKKLLPPPVTFVAVSGRLPLLRAGMKDPVAGVYYVSRVQAILNVKKTSVYDAATVAAVKAANLRLLKRTVDGRSVDAVFWDRLLGLK